MTTRLRSQRHHKSPRSITNANAANVMGSTIAAVTRPLLSLFCQPSHNQVPVVIPKSTNAAIGSTVAMTAGASRIRDTNHVSTDGTVQAISPITAYGTIRNQVIAVNRRRRLRRAVPCTAHASVAPTCESAVR